MTPLTLAKTDDVADQRVVNMGLLLLSFNSGTTGGVGPGTTTWRAVVTGDQFDLYDPENPGSIALTLQRQ